VNRPSRLARMALWAYPRAFRRAYGDEILRSTTDLRTHGGRSRGAVRWLVVTDVARTAPRMRLESLMDNHRALALTGVVTVAVLAAVVGSPVLLLLVAAMVAAMAMMLRRGDRPIVTDPASTSHWYRWVAAGAVGFAVGFVVLAVDGDELTSAGWTVWMLSWTAGLVLVLFGLVLVAGRYLHRRA